MRNGGYDILKRSLIGRTCFFEMFCFQLGRKRNSVIFSKNSKAILPWKKTIFFTIICNERLFSISLRRRYLFEKFEQFLIRSNFVSPCPFYFTSPKKNPKEKSQNLVTFWKINLNGDLF